MLLALLPFVLIAIVYMVGSAERRAANPDDKLLPPLSRDGADARTASRSSPTGAPATTCCGPIPRPACSGSPIGLGIATLIGPRASASRSALCRSSTATLGPLVAVLSMIPPMAILPILFIVFGLGDLSKVVLIVFGVAPFLMRDLALAVAACRASS